MRANIINGDAYEVLKSMDQESVDCVITSPPYWQKRDYGTDGQIGLEPTWEIYLSKLLLVFGECKRVLKPTGSMWIVICDSYAGWKNGITDHHLQYLNDDGIRKRHGNIKERSLIGIPDRLRISLIDDSWVNRNKIIWRKPNVMPSSADNRFTIDFEDVFWFTKLSTGYYFKQQKEPFRAKDKSSIKAYLNGDKCRGSRGDLGQPQNGRRKQDSIGRNDYTGFNERYIPPSDGMRNKRTVWDVVPSNIREEHFATFPEELINPMMDATCPKGGIVLDPFCGSGTTGIVAKELNLDFIGIDLNESYCEMAQRRISEKTVQESLFSEM